MGMSCLEERGMLLNDQDHHESVAITWLLSFEKIAANLNNNGRDLKTIITKKPSRF
jgi:hypothetical protein